MQLIIALAQILPGAIDAIRASSKLTAEEKAAALDALEGELEQIRKRVAEVKFKDVAPPEPAPTPPA